MEQSVTRAPSKLWWSPRTLLGRPNESLLEALLPKATFWHKLAIALLFIGLLVAFGRARFYLPNNPVPITMQTFGVLLAGGVLGLRWGFFAVVAWYFLGMAGVPVFQGGGNGWAYVSGATSLTGGYLIGFILAGTIVGFFSQRGWTHSRTLWPMLLAALLLYLPGLLFLASFAESIDASNVFNAGMYPFIPGDLVKVVAAALITSGLWTVADRRRGR